MEPTQFNAVSFRRKLAVRNLEQLANYEPPAPEGLPDGSFESDPSCGVALKLLEAWTRDNKETMQKAKDIQVWGRQTTTNWNAAFFAFMESTAVYLRDWGKHRQAWGDFRRNLLSDTPDLTLSEAAVDLYIDATKDIQTLAQYWDMEFFEICDLIHTPPKGQKWWDGPYCGAFVTTAAQLDKPFMGLAFKGTNPLNFREVLVDYNYELMPGGNVFPSQCISQGVFTGLFGEFDGKIPYQQILTDLVYLGNAIPRSGTLPVRLHVTGHSLGGSYSSMGYARLLRDVTPSPPEPYFSMGDQYTFGAPRVGDMDWAQANSDLVKLHNGLSWRIVNDNDIVPQVPATTIKPEQLNFYHVDSGVKIFKDKPPMPLETERRKPPPPPYDVTWANFIKMVVQAKAHVPYFYYDSLRFILLDKGIE